MGMSVAGTPESVRGINRKKLVEFYRKHYVPSGIVASFAGKVQHDACVELVQNNLGRMKGRKPGAPCAVTSRTAQQHVLLKNADIEQAHMFMGFRIFGRKDPRRYVLRVMNAVLGENMSSRLFYTVREKHGLAYSIQSSAHLMHDTGVLMIAGGFDRRRIEKALQLTVKELVKLKQRAVPQKELQRAKDYITGQIKLGMESTSSRMIWGGEQLLGLGSVVTPDAVIAKINSVTAEEIMALSSYVLAGKRLSLACVAPDIESSQYRFEEILTGL